jgi:alpha-glucosidase
VKFQGSNKRGERFELRNVDAMGYDAESTQPLYKHFPFIIHRDAGVSVGLFYDSLATAEMNCGNEIDNYHGPFFSYRAESADLDTYVMVGQKISEVTEVFTKLTGATAMPPKWSFGYSGSTMTYTDAPDAQKQLNGFLSLLKKYKIPCESFHLSSGYTSIGKKRYVFNWNREKIPDPAVLVQDFKSSGLRIIPNIKPVLLQDHPKYSEAKDLFVRDAVGAPELSQFWDGLGSHLDFTNPKTIDWWKVQIKEQLLSNGIEALWNDNNEYEVWDESATCHGFGSPWRIHHGRAIQTLLMAMASRAALLETYPDRRPFVVSRSGMPGMQRYVQTWSGDNFTSWKTLKFNLYMTFGLGLSGVFNTGHDVGGFSGPLPTPELFLRWIQHGIFYPRFVIHSWKDGEVNEPWMYREILSEVRDAMELRERLKLFFYNTMKNCVETNRPFIRPLFFDYEEDSRTFQWPDLFFVGRNMLVGNALEEEQKTVNLYLPEEKSGWFNFNTGEFQSGGQVLIEKVSLEIWPIYIRGGSVIPVIRGDELELLVYPGKNSSFEDQVFDDDGLTYPFDPKNGVSLNLKVDVDHTGRKIKVEMRRTGSFAPIWQRIRLSAPQGWTITGASELSFAEIKLNNVGTAH